MTSDPVFMFTSGQASFPSPRFAAGCSVHERAAVAGTYEWRDTRRRPRAQATITFAGTKGRQLGLASPMGYTGRPQLQFSAFGACQCHSPSCQRGSPSKKPLELYSTSYPIIPSLCHSPLPITQVSSSVAPRLIPAYRFSGSSTQGGVASINRPSSGSSSSILHFICQATLR